MKNILMVTTVIMLAGPALAQQAAQQGHNHGTPPAQTPYAGLETRPIKALSEKEIQGLRAAQGLGFALPAELNGYPGPLHTLELADDLDLSAEQRKQIDGFYQSMRQEAIKAGEALIAAERELDALFAEKKVTPENLAAATQKAGAARAELRRIHLSYHLSTTAILTPAQVEHYGHLRGYGNSHDHKH